VNHLLPEEQIASQVDKPTMKPLLLRNARVTVVYNHGLLLGCDPLLSNAHISTPKLHPLLGILQLTAKLYTVVVTFVEHWSDHRVCPLEERWSCYYRPTLK
jgi:hypothetical protein